MNIARESEFPNSTPDSATSGTVDLSHYELEELKRDANLALFRGRYKGNDGGTGVHILLWAPIADHPSPTTLRQMREDHAIRSGLDGDHVVRALTLRHMAGRVEVAAEDPGALPLDCVLNGPMAVAQFLPVAISIATAVAYVHAQNVVHKDIKPANILVSTSRSRAWLAGFGIASRIPRERQAMQPPEVVTGTLAYMAPEQTGRMNRSVDSRSDLYALGITFFEMLTGSTPFDASDPMELIHCHIARKPMAPSEKHPTIPHALSLIVLKLLAKTAEERYQTAAGLANDLRICQAEWQTCGSISQFPLAQKDAPDRLLIPEELYGRESELTALLGACSRIVAGGGPELVLVSGYSGIGKSSLVNELGGALVATRGLFASGKFDQFNRDVPYATFAQALQSLVRPLLGKREEDLEPWRTALREALGPNAALIVNLVPDLHLVIGDSPPIPDIPLQEAQRRFQLVMRRFIGVFARPEHPLALFIDDLQWLDTATLDLIEDLIAQSDLRHFILIGAYRDNEVKEQHPLLRKLSAIRSSGALMQELVLKPLTVEDVARMTADTLRCAGERASALATLIHERTEGNPFFAIAFVTSLYEEGLIRFDYKKGEWEWDLDRIREQGFTENVVDLLVAKLNRLSAIAKESLKLLACLGHSAEIGRLKIASREAEQEVDSGLLEAIQAGLIVRVGDFCKFAHDRVQEAAYSLVPESLVTGEHLRIARVLAARTPVDEVDEKVFEIVGQFHRGAASITSTEEREQVAELSVRAAKRARSATAYASARNLVMNGAKLLPRSTWKSRPGLCFALEFTRAECEFLSGQPSEAERILAGLFRRASNTVEQAATTCLQIDVYTALNRSPTAVAVALRYLKEIGIDCPLEPSEAEVKREYEKVCSLLKERGTLDIQQGPMVSDPATLATLDVFTRVTSAASFMDLNLAFFVVCKAVILTLERGHSDGGCFAFVMMAQLAGPRFGDYPVAFRCGQLGYELVEQRGLRRFQACTYLAFAIYTVCWMKHIHAYRSLVRRAFEAANANADLNFAALCWPVTNCGSLFAGENLAEVQQQAEQGAAFAQNAKFDLVVDLIAPQLALIRTLRGLTDKFGRFGPELDERQFEEHFKLHPGLALAEDKYWVRKMQARYMAGEYVAALEAAAKAQRQSVTSPGNIEEAEYHYYAALARAALCEGGQESLAAHLEPLTEHLRQLDIWAQHCPENFENRAALVGAEIARLEGRLLEAEHLFERAICAARDSGFMHNQAIASERAASFYARRGLQTIARAYLYEARTCYLQWGATAKVRQLDEVHPELCKRPVGSSVLAPTIDAPVEHLDLAAVINTLQTVSGEFVTEKLLETLARTAIEQSGAQRGLLILTSPAGMRVAAEAVTGDAVVVRLRDDAVSGSVAPEAILREVARTQVGVIVDDAATLGRFVTDPYVRGHNSRSLLCMPLTNRGALVGILYLENNLAPRVFAPGRVAVLKLLASQAAMLLENTRLYRDLAQREARIRRLVDANVVGILLWDLDGHILEANDEFLRIVDYRRDDLIAGRLHWTDLTALEYRGVHRDTVMADLTRTGSAPPTEWEWLRRDGTRVPVLIGAATFEGETRGAAFVLDLSEGKRVDQALRQSEGYLAEAQRLTHTGSWAYNYIKGEYTYYSTEQFRIHGLDPGDGKPPPLQEILELFHPEDRNRLLELVWRIRKEKCEYAVDYRIALPNGTVKYLHSVGHPVVNEDGDLLEHFGSVVDVSERTRAEQRLRAQHEVARILADAAGVEDAAPKLLQILCECLDCHLGLQWSVDDEKDVLRCTTAWHTAILETGQYERAARASASEMGWGLVGRVWAQRTAQCVLDLALDVSFVHREMAGRDGLHAALAFPILVHGEVSGVFELLSRDVWQPEPDLLVMIAAIGSQIGQFMERKRAENALQVAHAELAHVARVMSLGELTASIAHEVNQPLGAIVTSAASCAAWLAAKPPEMVKAQRALERIINDGRRAGEVIKRIRALMKRQTPRKGPLDMNETILEVIALVQHEIRRHQISVETQLAGYLPLVQGDKVQLQQVLLNLIVNAIEAMGDIDRFRELTIVSSTDSVECVWIEVRDSGTGFGAAAAARIFEPFYTTKVEGIGIGLSISRSIIEAHGGQLTGNANMPHGAVFRFSLPLEEPVA